MATIGFVSKQEDGSFRGRLTTISLQCDIKFAPNKAKTKDQHPDFRILARKEPNATPVEIGAAWIRTNREGEPYVSASIAAPELGRRIFANLGQAAGQDDPDVFALIWNEEGAAPVAATGTENGW